MRRNQLRSFFLIFLITCLTIGVGLLGDIFPPELEVKLRTLAMSLGLPFPSFWILSLALLITLALAAIFIKEWSEPVGETAGTNAHDSKDKKDRRNFLADLARRYAKRYSHKLDGRYDIPLLVSDETEGTGSQQPDEESGDDEHGMSKAAQYVVERFETLGRLALVGSAGSGKTGLLLSLAKHLAEEARKDDDAPLPVILNLAYWSRNYPSFGAWVKDMLVKGYNLSPKFAKGLHEGKQLVYLLDGLDELASDETPVLAADMRRECLTSLTGVLNDGSVSAVVCCRGDEFDDMVRRTGSFLPVRPLTVHDLSSLRVDRALNRAGRTKQDRVAAPHLQALLAQDAAGIYYHVLSTPFFFTTALQVFDSPEPPVIAAPDEDTLKANLLAGFVEKKLGVPTKGCYPHDQTLDWLTWLAVFLKGRVTFELSDLQPFALRRPWLYRLLFCLFCGGFGGLVVLVESRIPEIAAIVGGLYSLISIYIITNDFGRWTFAPLRRWRTWLIALPFGAIVAVAAGLLFLVARLTRMEAGELTPITLIESIMLAVFFMILAGALACVAAVGVRLFIRVAVGIKGGVPLSEIVTEDFGHWRLRPLLRPRTWGDILLAGVEGGVAGLFVVSVILLIFMAAFVILLTYFLLRGGLIPPTLADLFATLMMAPIVIIMAVVIGFLCGFVIGLPVGVIKVCRETARFVSIHSPYQRLRAGVILNILQAVAVGWFFFDFPDGVYNLTGYLHGSQEFRPSTLLPNLPIFLTFGMVGLFRTPLLKHLILRVCLRLEGAMPLRYARFLNHAMTLGFLESDGGQWRFRHQILQDHFAGRRQAALNVCQHVDGCQ